MIRDQADLNSAVSRIVTKAGSGDFSARMAAGKAKASAARANSNAPPAPVKSKSKTTAVPPVATPAVSIPAPAKSKGKKPGASNPSGTSIVHNHYYGK